MEAELLQADILLFVVDPFPAKWSSERMKAAHALCFERDNLSPEDVMGCIIKIFWFPI